MQFARRIFRLALHLGCMSAIGAGVFFYVRAQPRCSFVAADRVIDLAADGSRLLTYYSHPARGGAWQVWDTYTGQQLFEWASDRDSQCIAFTNDGRHLAVSLETGPLRLFDWQAGQHWDFDEPLDLPNGGNIEFSAKGRWLVVHPRGGHPSFLIDVASRKIVRRGSSRSVFSADERLLFDLTGLGEVTVWDLAENKSRGVLPVRLDGSQHSPDGRLLIERHWDEKTGDQDQIDAWDVATLKLRFRHSLPRAGQLNVQFSSDSRLLAVWHGIEPRLWDNEGQPLSDLGIIDTATGKRLWSCGIQRGGECVFSPDNSLVHLVHGFDDGTPVATMFDANTGNILWQRTGRGKAYFAQNADMVLHRDNLPIAPIQFLDPRTGAAEASVPLEFQLPDLTPTPDGRYFVIRGHLPTRQPAAWETWLDQHWPNLLKLNKDPVPAVIVFETATVREVFRTVGRDETLATLSADASTLVTVESVDDGLREPRVFDVWDVQPTKAWLWALGVALAAAIVWQIGVRLVQRFRKRKAA
jgi:hypothetical protein